MNMNAFDLAEARASLPRPERCRAIRQGAQLSLTDLADELGTSPHTVSRWERGEGRPSRRLVVSYVALLQRLEQLAAGRPG